MSALRRAVGRMLLWFIEPARTVTIRISAHDPGLGGARAFSAMASRSGGGGSAAPVAGGRGEA